MDKEYSITVVAGQHAKIYTAVYNGDLKEFKTFLNSHERFISIGEYIINVDFIVEVELINEN